MLEFILVQATILGYGLLFSICVFIGALISLYFVLLIESYTDDMSIKAKRRLAWLLVPIFIYTLGLIHKLS